MKTGADVYDVRISTRNVPLSSTDTSTRDVVVMDDFLYGEPAPS